MVSGRKVKPHLRITLFEDHHIQVDVDEAMIGVIVWRSKLYWKHPAEKENRIELEGADRSLEVGEAQ